jgi:hypothetical protein
MKTFLLAAALICALICSVVGQKHNSVLGDIGSDRQSSLLLKGVDHFFATSSEPEVLPNFFRDTLELPQVWAFKDFGDFASGGVWMGNVEFEVVTWKPPPGEKLSTEFKGIAFEPAGYTDSLVQELDRRGIKHGKTIGNPRFYETNSNHVPGPTGPSGLRHGFHRQVAYGKPLFSASRF